MSIHLPPESAAFNHHLDLVRDATALTASSDLSACAGLEFIFLCYTNRCGSNYLSEALASDGQLNLATEIFNGEQVCQTMMAQGLKSFSDYFIGVSMHNARSGRFITKIAIGHLNLLFHSGILGQILPKTRFIFMERSDKLSQAISMCLAAGTSRWASYNESTIRPEEVPFSIDEIDTHLNSFVHQNTIFEYFFARNGLIAGRVIYEQFVQSPDGILRYLQNALGLPTLEFQPSKVRTDRQAGAVNAHWRRRYIAAYSGERG